MRATLSVSIQHVTNALGVARWRREFGRDFDSCDILSAHFDRLLKV